jgi:hypothetical protein
MPGKNTMALINRLVAKLPPFPLGAPLPDMRTGKYLEVPCGTPKARFGIAGVGNPCQCGFEMGDHPRAAVAERLAAE